MDVAYEDFIKSLNNKREAQLLVYVEGERGAGTEKIVSYLCQVYCSADTCYGGIVLRLHEKSTFRFSCRLYASSLFDVRLAAIDNTNVPKHQRHNFIF